MFASASKFRILFWISLNFRLVRMRNFFAARATILLVIYSNKNFKKTGHALNTACLFPSIFIYEKDTTNVRHITRSRRHLTGWRPVQPWLWFSAASSSGCGRAAGSGVCPTSGSCVHRAADVRHATRMRCAARGSCSSGARLRIWRFWLRQLWIPPFLRTVSPQLPRRLPRTESLSPVRGQSG